MKKGAATTVSLFVLLFIVIAIAAAYRYIAGPKLYMMPHYTPRRREPSSSPQGLPRVIHEFWHTREVPYYMSKNIQGVIEANPEFDFYLYSEKEARAFINTHFPEEVLAAYDSLKPTAYKSDLFRYCALYIKGGFYMDTKFYFDIPLETLAASQTPLYVLPVPGWCPTKNGIMNGFMAAPPGSETMRQAIAAIVKSCQGREYKEENDLALTGPCLLGDITDKQGETQARQQSPLTFDDPTYTIRLHGKVIGRSYPEYRDEQKATQNEPYYKDLYKARDIYW
jgi:mannosyltransferase OCH1-like enzyme